MSRESWLDWAYALQAPCGRCGHQQGCHTGGAARGGWAIYEPTWARALGWCTKPGCACPARTSRDTPNNQGEP